MDVGGDSGGNRGSPMKIERFEMERYQSTWENTVEFNLADSGVHPITLAALVDHSWIREVLAREQLGYGHTNRSESERLGRRRRGVSGRGAGRASDQFVLGPLPEGHRHRRALQGLRPARASDRVDDRPARHHRGLMELS